MYFLPYVYESIAKIGMGYLAYIILDGKILRQLLLVYWKNKQKCFHTSHR